jgi:hypothetical protein
MDFVLPHQLKRNFKNLFPKVCNFFLLPRQLEKSKKIMKFYFKTLFILKIKYF